MKFLRLDDYLNFGEDPIKDINFENKIQEYDTYFSNEIEKKLPEDFLKEYYFNSEYFESPMNKDFEIDEFGIIKDTCLSHEVYFPSGASYIVHFSDIEILSS